MLPSGSNYRFLKPGEIDKNFQEDIADIDPISSTTFVYNPNVSLSYDQQRQRLPIFNSRNHILYLLEKYQVLVLVGETGCGKSTQLPQYLHEAGWTNNDKLVGITEPRRVAATTLAARVAEEKGSPLGALVGYSIRFDDCSDPTLTRIKYMTEGILLREMMADPLLRQYSVIILDEVHERTLYTDIIMGLMKKILKKNTNLKLIVSSATCDAEELQYFFSFNPTKDKTKDKSVIMSVPGRMYSVDVFYLQGEVLHLIENIFPNIIVSLFQSQNVEFECRRPVVCYRKTTYEAEPVPDYVQGVVDTVLKIHKNEIHGDILAFLTGQEEVERAAGLLREQAGLKGKDGLRLFPLPMHGSLPNSDQLKVFRPCERGDRKVIIATNIAETSVTIPGIVYVIDSGFVKLRWFNPETCTDSLVVVPISKSSAEQRAGRAGRERTGKVFRLYRESDYDGFINSTPCEMQRTELATPVIQLKALGIDNVLRFNFPSPPPAKNLAAALEFLFALEAIDKDGELTKPLGVNMAEFPIHPSYSKILLASGSFGCSEEILTILSGLQVQTIFTKPISGSASIKARIAHRDFQVTEGDLLTLLNAWSAFVKFGKKKDWCHKHFLNYRGLKRLEEIRTQMKKLVMKFDVPIVSAEGNGETVRRAIAAGLFQNAAYLHHSGVYKSIRGDQDLFIHPSSVLYTLEQPQWVLFCDIIYTNKAYMKNVTVINPTWLEELAPHFYQKRVVRNY